MAIFKCAGRLHSDDDGAPVCLYEAVANWSGPCPGCGRFYNCDKVGADKQLGRERLTAGQSDGAKIEYVPTGIDGLDAVLGGGLVRGNIAVAAGPQGSGKTSLLMAACDSVARSLGKKTLYASAEEYGDRVLGICQRLGIKNDDVEIMDRSEAYDVDSVLNRCDELKPFLAVFDSLQMMKSDAFVGAPGSVTQSDNIAKLVNTYCKRTKMCAVLVNHMTKQLEFKGGTGVTHEVDICLALYKYNERDDGSAIEIFGKKALRAMGLDLDAENFDKQLADRVRTLAVFEKSRQSSIGTKSFFEMTDEGHLLALLPKSSLDIGG